MSVKSPSYLLKKSYSYYARIRVPKDIGHKFRYKSELRFTLRTIKVTDAKSKARLISGLLQWVFRNIRNGGYLSMLNDEQINKLITDYIKKLLDEDLEFRLESPQSSPKGESHRIMAHSDMVMWKDKTLGKLLDYDFSEVSDQVEMILKEAGYEVPNDTIVFNKMCQKLLKGHVQYFEVLAERALGGHLLEGLNDQFELMESDAIQQTPKPTNKVVPNCIALGKLAQDYWDERAENWKPRSQQNYRTYQNRIIGFFSEDTPVESIDYYRCKDFRDWLRNSRKPPLSVKKVNDYLDYLKGMFNFELKTTRTLKFNPADGLHLKDTQDKQDGGCLNNPGPGGYGVVLNNGKKTKELSGGYRLTTNNRMELMACIVGLDSLKKGSSVTLISDSKYVVDGIQHSFP